MTDRLLYHRPPVDWQPPGPEQEALADALWLPIVPPSTPTQLPQGMELQAQVETQAALWRANPSWRRRLWRMRLRVRYRWLRLVRWVSIATGHATRQRDYRLSTGEPLETQWIREEDHL